MSTILPTTNAQEERQKSPEKKWAKGVILVNNYQPPKEKTLEDFTKEAREKVKHLELHALPVITHQTIIEMLKGKVFFSY